MNYEKLGNWLQIAANIGIVIGLLLVGVQLKQNSDLLKIQLLYEESRRAIELETQVVGENGAAIWARSITAPGELTLAEQRVMEALLWSFTEQLRATHMLSELGLIDDADWRQRVRSESAFFLANHYGGAWWKNYSSGNNLLPEDLRQAVNERLTTVDNTFTGEYMRKVKGLIEP